MNKILFSIFAVLLTLVLLCSACSKTDSASSVPISEHSNEVPEITDTPDTEAEDDEDEFIDDSGLESNEEYFSSLGDIVGEWSSDYVDRSIYFFDSQTFAFIYADTDRSSIRADGSYDLADKNLVVLSFYDYSDYEGNINLHVKSYDTMTTDDGENFKRIGVYDQSDYIDESNNEYGVVNTDGVISFTWFGTEKPEDLSFFIYDENDALINTYTKSETSADGYMTTLFVIRAGVNPTRIEITGTELETANTIMSDIVLNIDMTHGTGDESDHYSILLDSLADCYERSYTGVWYYNIPVHWYELYLAEAQAD